MLTFNWVLENQPMASGILTQSSHYKRTESKLLADQKGSQQGYLMDISPKCFNHIKSRNMNVHISIFVSPKIVINIPYANKKLHCYGEP